jgi:two-component system nitrate/nitrite response regulator NarL
VTIVAGSNALFREGLSRILITEDFRILASVPRLGDCAPDIVKPDTAPLFVIVAGDDNSETVAQIKLFKVQHPAGRVAVVASDYVLNDMVLAYRAGANAYFAKASSHDAFIKSLELVMLGETVLPPAILSLIDDHKSEPAAPDPVANGKRPKESESAYRPRLSAREEFVLRCLIEGDSNKVIARKMAVADATVKAHVKSILRKIRAQNRTQAAIWAMNNNPSLMSNTPSLFANGVNLGGPAGNGRCIDQAADLPVLARHDRNRLSGSAALVRRRIS